MEVKNKHSEMLKLLTDMELYYLEVPATYDGELPEFAFLQEHPRLLIGEKYIIPKANGEETTGILESATVQEIKAQGTASGIYLTEMGERLIINAPLTDTEFRAYKASPDTFFGEVQNTTKKISSPIELFEIMYETYKNTPRDTLMGWMKEAKDIKALKKLNDEELLITYCEGISSGVVKKS